MFVGDYNWLQFLWIFQRWPGFYQSQRKVNSQKLSSGRQKVPVSCFGKEKQKLKWTVREENISSKDLPEKREHAGWMRKAHLKMTSDGSYTSSAFKGCWGSTHLNFNQRKRRVFISPLSGLKTNLKRSAFVTPRTEMSLHSKLQNRRGCAAPHVVC